MTVMTPNCNGVENSSLLTKWMLEQNTPNFQTKCPLHRTQIQIQNIENRHYIEYRRQDWTWIDSLASLVCHPSH